MSFNLFFEKKKIWTGGIPFLLAAALALGGLSGCGAAEGGDGEEARITVVASTYPVYLFARTVADGVGGVEVTHLNTGEVSCLHDYTLTVNDMKKIEGADVLALNGAGLEDFMDDALASARGSVIDCSEGLDLLENEDHDHQEGEEDHDHGHYDPHYWMDPENAEQMVVNLQNGLIALDPDHEGEYRQNSQSAVLLLDTWGDALRDSLAEAESAEFPGLITFHDGFRYFAQAFDLPLLASIEEEEGSEASAKEINEISALVKEHGIPVIFTEVNGSDATANAIARETGCQVSQLTMLMSGPEDGTLEDYYDGLSGNVTAIVNGFAGKELAR